MRVIREYTTTVPTRHDVLQFAPLILAALYRAGHRGPIDVDRVIAVFEDAGHSLSALEWGDLCAMASEALDTSNRDVRNWRARARGRLIPAHIGFPASFPVAQLAVADETLATLVMRADAWSAGADLAGPVTQLS
jgi:hypothetical protein